MMMRYVRVLAEPTPDNSEAPPLRFDAIIDEAGSILGKHMLHGVQEWPDRRDETSMPFSISSAGRLDYAVPTTRCQIRQTADTAHVMSAIRISRSSKADS